MGSVHPFPTTANLPISDQSFDAETTALICQGFDLTCRELHDRGQPAIVREVIATRIIESAGRGERDPEKMRDAALLALGFQRDAVGRLFT
jgi:hypothetical protein